MEFYDDLTLEQYNEDFLFNLFKEYKDRYGYKGLEYLLKCLDNYLFNEKLNIILCK